MKENKNRAHHSERFLLQASSIFSLIINDRQKRGIAGNSCSDFNTLLCRRHLILRLHPYAHPYACVISPLHLSSPQSSTKFTHNLLHQVTDDKTATHGESFLPQTSKLRHRFSPTIILKNSGSVARDHLASERTFLSYLRTSLALATAGVGTFKRVVKSLALIFIVFKALVQMFGISQTSSHIANEGVFPIHKLSHPLGAALVSLGIIVLVFGPSRTFSDRMYLTA